MQAVGARVGIEDEPNLDVEPQIGARSQKGQVTEGRA